MGRLVRLLLGEGRESDRVVECRHCGTTLPATTDACPECDVGSTVTYEIR